MEVDQIYRQRVKQSVDDLIMGQAHRAVLRDCLAVVAMATAAGKNPVENYIADKSPSPELYFGEFFVIWRRCVKFHLENFTERLSPKIFPILLVFPCLPVKKLPCARPLERWDSLSRCGFARIVERSASPSSGSHERQRI